MSCSLIGGFVAQLNRASDYGSEGCGFESLRSHNKLEAYRKRCASILFVDMNFTIARYSSHYRQLTVLGLPIIIGQLGNIVMGFADTLMVGRHSMEELAAASFVNTMMMIFIVFALGFSYGLTPIVGNLFGRGERDKIGGMVKNAIAANTLLAVLFVAVLLVLYFCIHLLGQPEELLPLMRPYLLVSLASMPFMCWMNTFKQFYDAIGDTKTPMYIILSGNLLNILGNWVLIYGVMGFPEMGLLGAGVATLFSRVVMAMVMAWLFFRSKRYAIYGQSYLNSSVNKPDFRRMNALGWPLGLQMGMETAAFSLTAIMVGWIGTTALAAHQIMLTISQLFYMVYYGMAAAVAVRVSYFHGQRDLQSLKDVSAAGFHLIILIAAIVSLPIFILRGDISSWFTDNGEVSLLVAQTVIPLILYQFGDGLQCTFANALRGIACVKPLMYIAAFSYFAVSLPLSWLFGIFFGFGLVGIWMAFPICLTTAGILYYLTFRKQTRDK